MPSLFLLGFLALFAGMWAGVSYFLSYLSGWRALAPRYPSLGEPAGERLIWTSAQLGGVSFRCSLNMTLSPAGLFLVPSLAFRLFMPPMLIPWSDVRFAGLSKFLFFEFVCLRLGGETGSVLCLFKGTGGKFLPFLTDGDRKEYGSGRRYGGSLIDRRIVPIMAAAGALGVAAALLAAFAAKR